jgi:hypothetical protein
MHSICGLEEELIPLTENAILKASFLCIHIYRQEGVMVALIKAGKCKYIVKTKMLSFIYYRGALEWIKVRFNPGKIQGIIISQQMPIFGDSGGTVVKVLCYKSEGRWFDSRWCHWNFPLKILPITLWTWGRLSL